LRGSSELSGRGDEHTAQHAAGAQIRKRLVGLLERDAPAGETLGVGLGSGLLVLASWWAAVASGGRSSFTPVAVGFAIAVALALFCALGGAGAPLYPKRANANPVVVVVVNTQRNSGSIARNAFASFNAMFTSPTLTACSHVGRWFESRFRTSSS